MNFIYQMINKIFMWFKKDDGNKQEGHQEKTAEIIYPIRFEYIKQNALSERSEEESLEVFKKFLNAEPEKQSKVSNTTKDYIIQEKIFELNKIELLQNLATNPWLSESLQYRMATDKTIDESVKICLSRKVGLSLEVQRILATIDNQNVRRMLVRWQRPINPAIAKILIYDEDLEVRKTIAFNIGERIKLENIISFKDSGELIQIKMVDDESCEVRKCLALNENLKLKPQLALVEKCFEEEEWNNIYLLIENRSINPECKEYILGKTKNLSSNFIRKNIEKKLHKI